MGKLEGKVAFITGAARGQGRSHALRLAQEGADIIAIDIAHDFEPLKYPLATKEDLAETVRQVEALDRRMIASVADVRDLEAVTAALNEGVAQLGRLDIAVANAGIMDFGRAEELSAAQWDAVIGTNLTGVWNTAKAAVPHIRAGGRGGSIIFTSSTFSIIGGTNAAHYTAAKHGVVGLMKSMALELAEELIRVNAVAPTTVDTTLIQNPAIYSLFAPDLTPEERTPETIHPRFQTLNAMPVPFVEPIDVSNAVLWLASDDARYVTGVNLPVDAGAVLK